MAWLNKLLNKVAGVSPTDWTLLVDLPDPGLSISGKPVVADQCYVELYVESLRLEKARRFATTFRGVIYSFASLPRQGMVAYELASVTTPKSLSALDSNNLDRVITVSKQIMAAMPWRGDPFGLELGLFSVKSGNLLTPLVDYVSKISDHAGSSLSATLSSFTSLITDGLDMIAGQKADTEIELAIDTDLSVTQSCLFALVAKPKGSVTATGLTIDPQDRKLLQNGQPLQAAYCVFSIRSTERNSGWGNIPTLRESYADFTRAVVSGKRKEAEEALAGFNRQVIVCPDLISADKKRLRELVKEELHDAFPSGGQSATPDRLRERFESRLLADLNLYGDQG